MKLKDDYAPLRQGTQATVRQASLSGVANRYLDLRMAPQSGQKIPDGGVIEQDATTTAVDLDQLFNTLDPADAQGARAASSGAPRRSTRARATSSARASPTSTRRWPRRAACSASSTATRRCSSASSSPPRSSSPTSPTAATTSPA